MKPSPWKNSRPLSVPLSLSSLMMITAAEGGRGGGEEEESADSSVLYLRGFLPALPFPPRDSPDTNAMKQKT